MYLARKLQPEGYGEYGVVVSMSSILMTLSAFGIQQVAIRRIAQQQGNSWLQYKVSIVARLIGYFLVAVLFITYCSFTDYTTVPILIIILLNVLMLTLWDGIQNVAFGMQRMEYTGYINVGGTALLFLIYIVLPNEWLTVFSALTALVIVAFVKNICYYRRCVAEKLFTYSQNRKIACSDIINLTKESFPFYMLAVLTLFSTQWPVIFLAEHSGTTEVAYYNTANKIIAPASLMLSTLMSAFFPNLAKEYITDKKRFVNKVNSMFRFLIVSGLFCAISLALFRDELVLFIFGAEYQSTGNVLLSQCWYLVFHAIFALMGNVLAAARKEKILAILALLYALVNTVIFWNASYYGAQILSYGLIIGCIINLSYHYYLFNKNITGFIAPRYMLIIMGIILLCIGVSFALLPYFTLLVRSLIWILIITILLLFNKHIIAYIKL